MSIIGTLFIGLIVGLVARFIKPGNDGMGWIMTIVLGICGSIAATYGGQALGLPGWAGGRLHRRGGRRSGTVAAVRCPEGAETHGGTSRAALSWSHHASSVPSPCCCAVRWFTPNPPSWTGWS